MEIKELFNGKIGNKEMINVIKTYINDKDVIKCVYKAFPVEFMKAAKYLPFKLRDAIRNVTGDVVEVKYRNKFRKESLGKYIEAGPRGITRVQMVPAITSQIDNEEAIVSLFNDYPEVFNKSVVLLETNELKEKVEAITGIKIKKTKKDNVIQFEIASEFKSSNNLKLANIVKNDPKVLDKLNQEEKELLLLAIKDIPTLEIAKLKNSTRDKIYNKMFRNTNSIYNKLA